MNRRSALGLIGAAGLLGSLAGCSSLPLTTTSDIQYGPIRSGRFSLSGPGMTEPLVGQFEWRQASGPVRQRLWLSDPWSQPQGSLMLMADGSGPWAGWQPLGPNDQTIEQDQAMQWARQTLGLQEDSLQPLGRLLTELGEHMLISEQPRRLQRVIPTPHGALALRLFVESAQPLGR
jgi:hypothetical protein